jgi:predicted nucleic acid-binding protein
LGVDRLRTFLRRHRRVGLDTSVFIYQLEANAKYVGLTHHVFSWLEQPGSQAVTSTITMTELLVHPYRNNDEQRVDELYALLRTYPNVNWIAPDLAIADLAARFRALGRLRTPDALHAATAVHAQVTGFITDAPVFRRVDAFDTLVLDELL